MEKQEKGFVAKFKEFISGVTGLTFQEAVEVAKIATEAVEVKFKDVMVGDKILRVEGEELKEGAAVVWYSEEDGSMEDVADGEYEVEEVGVIVIAEGVISEIKPAGTEEAEAEAAGEDAPVEFNAEASYKELLASINELKSKFEAIEPVKAEEVDIDSKFAEMEAKFAEQIKSIPAISGVDRKQSFSSQRGGSKYRSTRK